MFAAGGGVLACLQPLPTPKRKYFHDVAYSGAERARRRRLHASNDRRNNGHAARSARAPPGRGRATGWWAGHTADRRTPFHDAAGARFAETLMLLRELAAREGAGAGAGASEPAVVTEEFLTGQTPADAYRHAVLRTVFAEVKFRVRERGGRRVRRGGDGAR